VIVAIVLLLLYCPFARSQPADPFDDPAYPLLVHAYEELNNRRYETAIAAFRNAVKLSPDRAHVHKDLAYTLLKIGENSAARDHFAEAMRLDPRDEHVALEYAFLCFETGKPAEARRTFDRIRKTGRPEPRATAEEAFNNIDKPLAEGIARWEEVVAESPGNFSAHRELARLADQRDQWKKAARHYEKAWRLRPDQKALLLDLGRVLRELGRERQSAAAFLAASRGAEPRAAEEAKELLPARYPYVYEFREALELDPENRTLRRELAYLLLAMDKAGEAETEFELVVEQSPEDLLSAAQLGFLRLNREDYQGAMPLLRQVLDGNDAALAARVRESLGLPAEDEPAASVAPGAGTDADAKLLGQRSLEAGYMADAMKYLTLAHQIDPTDFEVMLELGKAYNITKRDEEAVQWFDLARRGPDAAVAAEADRSYKNLSSGLSPVRFSFWAMPFYSSRWKDAFGYAQFKTEVRLGKLPIRPYISVRFAGDARRTIGSVAPQYLSESSFVFGVGLRTLRKNGVMAWVEAGSDVSYLDRNDRHARMVPDYRAGVSFAKTFGSALGGEAPGVFFNTNDDGVFMSRFDNAILGYSQNRLGYTPPAVEALGGLETQIYWNGAFTVDSKQQHWTNFAEFGPGFRFRWKPLPASMVFSIDLLRGVYLLKHGPRGPNYNDIRIGVWYAFTK